VKLDTYIHKRFVLYITTNLAKIKKTFPSYNNIFQNKWILNKIYYKTLNVCEVNLEIHICERINITTTFIYCIFKNRLEIEKLNYITITTHDNQNDGVQRKKNICWEIIQLWMHCKAYSRKYEHWNEQIQDKNSIPKKISRSYVLIFGIFRY
jgi:hypothetical protein